MELKIGDQFELEVIDICSNTSGYDYLLTMGPDDKTHNIYNIIKCQYASLPNTIYGIVTGFNENGVAKFKQDECRVLKEHYILGRPYLFTIADRKSDRDKKYYVLEDDFSYQRWYSEEDLEIGDEIVLEAKSYTKSGYIYYDRHKAYVPNMGTEESEPKQVETTTGNYPVLDISNEDQYTELKTSIVFTPKHEANIDTQMFNIVREIASFMNADGGTLYIGVHDKTHEVLGISKDFTHLCEGESPYASSYTADEDHYALKIRDTVVSMCGGVAGSLIQIDFPQQEGVTYCTVKVSPAKRPIWVKGNMLFQRQGNQTQMLRGEAITQFVGERIGSYMLRMVQEEGLNTLAPEEIGKMIHNVVKEAINDRRKKVAAEIILPIEEEIKYWLVWYADGSYIKAKEKQDEANVFKQIPVTDDTQNLIVAFCHKSGTLNTVKLADFLKGVTLKKAGKYGFNPKEKPIAIYICHPTDLLAIHSADTGGTEYIKIHHLTDVNTTGSGRNWGAYIIPRNIGHVLDYTLLTPIQAANASKLMALKRETSQVFGHNLDDITVREQIEYLLTL